MTLPIFSGGNNRANLDLAQIHKHMAIVEYEKAVQSAFREVADALAARDRLVDQLRAEQSLLETEREQARQAVARFDAGWSDRPTGVGCANPARPDEPRLRSGAAGHGHQPAGSISRALWRAHGVLSTESINDRKTSCIGLSICLVLRRGPLSQ